MRVAGALVLAGVAGFLLGACGGGGGASSALSTRTGLTATRSQPTVAQPTSPVTAEAAPTVATTTVEVTTTAPRPTTPTPTRPQLTVTLTSTTSTVPATTTAPAPAVTPTTTASEPTSSSETPWGWIALVLALTGLAVLGILLWGRRRSRRASQSAHLADLRRRTLITLDDVVAQGSVVAGQVEALAAEARDLERHAPGDEATAAVAPVRAALDELAEALDADRTLRLATPPPSADQLAYSDALIRRQVTQLQEALRSP